MRAILIALFAGQYVQAFNLLTRIVGIGASFQRVFPENGVAGDKVVAIGDFGGNEQAWAVAGADGDSYSVAITGVTVVVPGKIYILELPDVAPHADETVQSIAYVATDASGGTSSSGSTFAYASQVETRSIYAALRKSSGETSADIDCDTGGNVDLGRNNAAKVRIGNADATLGFFGDNGGARSVVKGIAINVTPAGTTDAIDPAVAPALLSGAASLVSVNAALYQLARKVDHIQSALDLVKLTAGFGSEDP